MNETIKQNIKQSLEKEPLSRISKQIRKETRIAQRLENQGKKLQGEAKQENQDMQELIREKVTLLLQAITPDKIKDSNISAVSKAFRSIIDRSEDLLKDKNKEPNKNISVNFNVNDLSSEDIIKLLNDKNNQQNE